MNWFRVYHDIIDDPKILALPLSARWHVVAMLCIGSRQPVRGTLPAMKEIAIHLRMRPERCAELIRLLVDHGFIDENQETGVLSIHGWSSRQFKSDDVTSRSSASMKRLRERSSEQPVNVHSRVRSETETDTEQKEPPIPPVRGKPFPPVFICPEDIAPEDWIDFEEMRRKIRKPMTDRARHGIVKKLRKLASEGHPIHDVLEQSIRNDWQDVYPIRVDATPKTNGHPKPKDTPEEFAKREQQRIAAEAHNREMAEKYPRRKS